MSSTPPRGGASRYPVISGPGDALLITAAAAAVAVIAGTWLTGQLAGLVFHGTWPPASIGQALQITLALPGHLHDPALAWPARARADLPGPAGFAAAAVIVAIVMTAAAVYAVRRLLASRSRDGFASRADLAQTLAVKAVIAGAVVTRPSLVGRKVTLADAGVLLGVTVPGRRRLAVSVEDSAVVMAAPRLGKTSQVIIPWLADWPGPALVTSIRPDVLAATVLLRRKHGPAVVLDPAGAVPGWPDRLTWSPVSGCTDYGRARHRADVITTVGRTVQAADSASSGFFSSNAISLLSGWLHAAAVAGRSMDDVLRWAFAAGDQEPVRLLAEHPQAAPGIADMLGSLYRLTDATRTSLWATVQASLAPLLSPAARAAFAPPPGQSADLAALINAGATVYLIADKDHAAGLAPVISAFVTELTQAAETIAARSTGARLDPPLGLFLDEAANIAPLPQLPDLMSHAGGSGIFTTVVLQSTAQARARWGTDGAAMLLGSATVKIALGGLSGEELRALSDLAGETDQAQPGWQHGPAGTTTSSTVRTQPVITPAQIRTLSAARREALVIHATTPAVKIRMTRHYQSSRKHEYEESAAYAAPFLAGTAVPATTHGDERYAVSEVTP
jgi:type IV secretion system protein VirD4